MGHDEPLGGETALERFYRTTEGALTTFRDKIKKDPSPALAAAALKDLHKACEEGAREYRQTTAQLPKEEPDDIADLTCEDP